jgi:hypothetical protein
LQQPIVEDKSKQFFVPTPVEEEELQQLMSSGEEFF